MTVGRPTEMNAEIIKEVSRLLPKTLYLETVADALGVHRTTFWRWYKRGLKEFKRLAKNPRSKTKASESLFLDFCNAVKKGLAESELAAVSNIKRAGRKNWTASAWLLERRWPERWGKPEIDSGVILGSSGRVVVEVKETVVDNRTKTSVDPAAKVESQAPSENP